MWVAKAIELDEHTERELHVIAKARRVEARLPQRALVILIADEGLQNRDAPLDPLFRLGIDRDIHESPAWWYHFWSMTRWLRRGAITFREASKFVSPELREMYLEEIADSART